MIYPVSSVHNPVSLECQLHSINACHTSPSSSSSVIWQTTGPKSLPKQFLHTVLSRASSFKRKERTLQKVKFS